MANLLTILLIYSISLLQLSSSSKPRRILHEPLFPIQWTPPPPPLQPSDPFPTPPSPFFPDSPPQTPSLPSSSSQPSNHQRANSSKNVIIGVSVLFAFLALLAFSGFFLYRRRIGRPPDTRKLIGGGGGGGGGDEGVGRFQQAQGPEFLYLGTMEPTDQRSRVSESIDSPYRKLSSERVEVGAHHHHHPSPELQPLPPLVGTGVAPRPAAAAASSDDDDAFYTPNRSVASSSLLSESSTSPVSRRSVNASSGRKEVTSRRTSPRMQLSDSPPSHIKHAIQPPLPPVPPPPPPPLPPPLLPPKVEKVMRLPPSLPPKVEKVMGPPPPPPPQFPDDFGRKREILEASMANRPSSRRQLLRPLPPEPASRLSNGSGSSLQLADEVDGKLDGEERPKLKPLHWDKVRASSDRAMVWDQLKSSSFQLNEDMIETLFVKNAGNPPTETSRRHVLPTFKQENRVLDPKKSQNIAILLRALNVTREEVTDALLDGNLEGLGVELFETLVKMAPTKEEELKLRDYNGDVSKLGSAETFLKAVLDIPFAFKRVDAMLYRANFESEVRFLRKSYETLEAACEDLSSSRLFLKLLEAVLRTGNRINSGTNRGAATAFKLDTLLKLVDVKGTDGKTTLLHFVVQEIIRSEGSTSDSVSEDPPNKGKAEEFRKQGLKVLSGLSSELGNVKKAAGMDSDVLSSYVKKLELGLEKIRSVLNLERSCEQGLKFFDSMKVFLTEAEAEIGRVKDEEKKAIGLVKEITEYFHGDAAKEEAHPLRIFMVVRDFLSVLDNVCKEVGRIQERAMMGSARISSSASLPVLHRYDPRLQRSSDEDSLSS